MAQLTTNSRRREKPILSCTYCRGRKLRCDRESPCGTCLQRGIATECTYRTSEQERKEAIDYRPHHGRAQARQRFARLENLVLEMRDRDLARNSGQTSGDRASPSLTNNDIRPFTPPGSSLADDLGKLSITDDHTVYTGSSHWVTILEDIRQLKDELSEDNDEHSAGTTRLGATSLDASLRQEPQLTKLSLLNSAPRLSKEDILAMLPPRKAVDRHVSHFFNIFDMAPFLICRKKFLAEYAIFWDNPSAAPIMWVGLLFAVLSMATLLQQRDLGPPALYTAEAQDRLETYRTATIHCLVAGEYLQQSRYTIETLSLHFGLVHNYELDAPIGNWIPLGVVIRIAMRMGLHRDPSHWPNILPLQAELRRRLWMMLYHLDFFTSTQFGLPRIIKDSQCDTRAPAHLFENDLGLDDNELPAERPRDEPTALLFLIERDSIIKVAAEIYDTTEAGPPSPATIAALDAKIQKVIEAVPAWLKYRPLESSVAENPMRVLQQMFMDILINKAVYLLHRRSFVKGSSAEDSARSNEICIKAALAILEHERRMSEETEPSGLMSNVRWKVSSSLNHEFLQATMMLCFALSRSNDGDAGARTNRETLLRRDDIVQALTHARSHWERIANRSVDARRAAQAIADVLQQDSDISIAQATVAASNSEFSAGFEPAESSYFGNFDYGQDFAIGALDPSFFTVGNDVPTFGSMFDDFVTGQNNM
ncbi:hypothetical protein CONLIGDRAFT_607106 [Coniochaeta ligniaria NRRL 30616]|uniref:Zn(2)-C6 fungal-type domain-containing protein n=1 Tax=Coniochaeta ligniaria NRRL 30616 TaxID=1408157 RepID=A0A1J7J2I4_9PEZI|nr:hypothetical protein CONLIGDRAFT_607106 [Coniochaeta ligniaria NRRL 30616]